MGVLSAPLQPPSLLLPSSSSVPYGSPNTTCPQLHAACTFSFHGTLRHHYPGSLTVTARTRTRKLSVRADAFLPELTTGVAATYGGLLLAGGFFAYTRSSSIGSLLGGLSGSILMGLVFFLSLNADSKEMGEAIGFGTALLFGAVFGIRLAATKKLFPAAPLLLLSVAASAAFVGAYLQDRV